jgi:hypothetical protein
MADWNTLYPEIAALFTRTHQLQAAFVLLNGHTDSLILECRCFGASKEESAVILARYAEKYRLMQTAHQDAPWRAV